MVVVVDVASALALEQVGHGLLRQAHYGELHHAPEEPRLPAALLNLLQRPQAVHPAAQYEAVLVLENRLRRLAATQRSTRRLHAPRRSEHAEGLAGSRLPVAQQVDVVAFDEALDERPRHRVVHLCLRRFGRERGLEMVKRHLFRVALGH